MIPNYLKQCSTRAEAENISEYVAQILDQRPPVSQLADVFKGARFILNKHPNPVVI